jgi:sialate O-acetylesterase
MICPLIPYAIRGVILYQGKSSHISTEQYRLHLTELIRSWRKPWAAQISNSEQDFPFLIVQSTNCSKKTDSPRIQNAWAKVREAQRASALDVGNAALVVTIDLGEEKSTHPKSRAEVGRRLALAARSVAYKHDIVFTGPTVKDITWTNNEVNILFENAGAGLISDGEPDGFTLADSRGKFFNAEASICGNTVILSSKNVPEPACVRYLWASNPRASLYNKEGLPAAPFEIKKQDTQALSSQ